jgi:hypothetical protein
MELDDVLLIVLQVVLEAIVLAVLLNKWSEISERRAIMKELNFIMKKFYSLLKAKDSLRIYYFVKLLSENENKLLKRVLLMDVGFITQKTSQSEYKDVLEMRNADFILMINPQMSNFHRLKNMTIENTFDFQHPEEYKEVLTSFLEYTKKNAAEFGVSV